MDVTNMVNNWLSGGSQNYGIGIAFSRPYELESGNTRNIASFLTQKTNSAFKPYLEVNYNQTINDERTTVTNNRPCRLFLYTFSGNQAVNFYSAGTVSIKTQGNANVFTGLVPQQLSKGVYAKDEGNVHSLVEIRLDEIEFIEHTFTVNGKQIVIRVPKDQQPPSQQALEKLYRN